MKLLAGLTMFAAALAAQTVSECEAAKWHGRRADAKACYARLAASSDPYLRAEGLWGQRSFKDANDAFRAATRQAPGNADYRVRWGRMYLAYWQPQDAAALFQEALKIRDKHAGALLGLALIAASNWEQKAAELAHRALEADPKLVEAQELLARVALEDNNEQLAVKEAQAAVAMSGEALGALSILASIDLLNDRPGKEWLDRIARVNPTYGDVWETAGHFFVINRRYEEGIAAYRRAVEVDHELWDARGELGVNLMRLGNDAEARSILEECYRSGASSPAVRNTLKLLDQYPKYDTFRTPTTIVRIHKKESAALKPYVESELRRAMATYEKKYQLKLASPVQLELYPNHEDFAVRTMGMPGLGALGVTFGTVVAMDSPSARAPGTNHWASTLWHELSHVYVLTATKHRVPRWFTEGLAVYEETATSPEWGDRLTPDVIQAIERKELLPVATLDRGFIHPKGPSQVMVSYFQGGQICEFIQERWGYPKLFSMIQGFAARKDTPTVIRESLALAPEEFDKQFLAWIDKRFGAVVRDFPKWKTEYPKLVKLYQSKSYDEVISQGAAVRDWFPDYVEAHSAYEMLADAHVAKNDKAAALKVLEDYARRGGRSPSVLSRLATLQEEVGNKRQAAATLARVNFIYPQDEPLHRRLGGLYSELGNREGAIVEYQALVGLKPNDQADAHYRLAAAYRAAGRKDEARDEVINALEAAPGYKAAQKLLLELDGKD